MVSKSSDDGSVVAIGVFMTTMASDVVMYVFMKITMVPGHR